MAEWHPVGGRGGPERKVHVPLSFSPGSLQVPGSDRRSLCNGAGKAVSTSPLGVPGCPLVVCEMILGVTWRNIEFLKIEVELIYSVVLVSGVQQSDSVIHIYIHVYILFHILF